MICYIRGGMTIRVGSIWLETCRREDPEAGSRLSETLPEIFSKCELPAKQRKLIDGLIRSGHVERLGAGMFRRIGVKPNKYAQDCATVRGLGIVGRGVVGISALNRMIRDGLVERLDTKPATWRWL